MLKIIPRSSCFLISINTLITSANLSKVLGKLTNYISQQDHVIGALLTPPRSVFILVQVNPQYWNSRCWERHFGDISLKLHNSDDSRKAQTGWLIPGVLGLLLIISWKAESHPFLLSLCFQSSSLPLRSWKGLCSIPFLSRPDRS